MNQLLILQPDSSQVRRLGDGMVAAANIVGLILGLAVAIALILALTA
jgi:hypothetical protein